MKIFRTIPTLIAITVAFFLMSMTGCEDEAPVKIDFKSASVTVVEFTYGSPDENRQEGWVKLDIPYNMFALQVDFEVERLEEPGFDNTYSSDGDNPLQYPVTDIRIITIGDYNERYPDGSVINDAFGVYRRFTMPYPVSWPDAGKDGAFITHWYLSDPLFLVVREAPTPGEHQFCVEFVLSDKRVLTSTTKVINFYEPENNTLLP